jgi:hypothetical protein
MVAQRLCLEVVIMRSLILTIILALFVVVPAPLLAQGAPKETEPVGEIPNDVETLKKTVAKQAELIEKLMKELAETRKALDLLKNGPVAQPADEGKPKETAQQEGKDTLEGKITGVSEDNKIVVIDLGKSHDLSEGDVFDVLRDGKKMGKIKVCRMVDKNISNADVVEPAAELLPGDKITRISRAKKTTGPSSQFSPNEPQSELAKLDRRITTLEGLYSDLAKQVERIQKSLENGEAPATASGSGTQKKASKPEETTTEPKRPFGLQARVASIEDKNVFLWVGSKHGVKEGDTFLIQRGEREIAWLRVVSLIKDMCRTVIVSKKADIRKDSDVAVLKPLSQK